MDAHTLSPELMRPQTSLVNIKAQVLTSLSMDGGLFEETLRDCHLENFQVLAIYVEVLEKNTFISSLSTLCGLMLGFK